MHWLSAGVPLTLLMDLMDASPTSSERILADEPADLSWLPTRRASNGRSRAA
jgi:hypothetical protein